MFDKIKTVEPC